jgi:DNA-directed RNA polymerase subunit RPC12/RpoP
MLKEEEELVPEYDQNVGFRYPEAERFIIGPVTETLYLIRKLYEAGILLKKYRDKAVACPSCLSPAVSVKYLCVSCSSSNLEKRRICEHVECGFSDAEELFLNNGEYVCPKCGKDVKRDELREASSVFRCRNCSESFEKPTWMHYCKKCKVSFTLNEASFIDVYSYVLSPDMRNELELGTMSITPIGMVFERHGFAVASPGSLKGKTGNTYTFDLLGRGKVAAKDVVVVLDIVYSNDPHDLAPVSTLMGKLIDTDADLGFLVVIPSLDQSGKNLAELYDIGVVEAESSKEAAEQIEKKLGKLLAPSTYQRISGKFIK